MTIKWNERYGKGEFYYGTEPNSFLVEQSTLFTKGSRVLCLGEGEGRNAVYLAKLGCAVTALDSSQVGLDKLHSLAAKNNVSVKTICCDLNDYVFESDRWDAIVSIWCHLPSQLRSKVHQGVVHGLKPKGVFILEAYTPEQLKYKTGGPQDPDMLPTSKILENELSGLDAVLNVETARPVSEGIGHQGMSAVEQYVGVKR